MGRPRFRILGGQGGPNSQQAHNVVTTSHRRHVPTRFLINQCQIITFLILKSDNKGNSRIELRGIVLPVPSNQIKITSIIILPSTWYICDFFLFHIEIEGKCGWTIRGGGGGKGYVGPPSQIIGGRACPPPLLSHSSGRSRGTTDDFATTPFHLSCLKLPKSIPVHSLILSSRLLLSISSFSTHYVFAKREYLEIWPNHLSF